MARSRFWVFCGVLGVALLVVGCGNAQKEATEAAVNAAQAAINSVSDEAAKYVPDQLAAANNALQTAKDELSKGDYSGALAAAKDVAGKAKELASAAAAKKQEWAQTWSSMSESTPKSLDAVKAKLDAYSRHLPAGMDQDKLAAAKTQYDQLKQTWADASSAAAKGNLRDAIQKSSGLKDLLAQLKEMLGIKS